MIKNLLVASIAFQLLLWPATATATSIPDWGPWKTYSEVTVGERRFLTVEVRFQQRKNWMPKAQWRITNHADATLYCVSIGERSYLLSSGETHTTGAEGCRTIEPGQTEKYLADTFGDEGVHVKSATMDFVSLRTEKDGSRRQVALS